MEKEILHFINQFNQSSLFGNIERASECLHEQVVFLGPDLKTKIAGKANCLNTIIEYNKIGETKIFELKDLSITQDFDGKMITMEYYVEYEMNARLYKENAIELLRLTQEDGNWKILWRALAKNEQVG